MPNPFFNEWGILTSSPIPFENPWDYAQIPGPWERPVLLVMRAAFRPNADTFSLYLNPTPGAPEPLSAAATVQKDFGQLVSAAIVANGRFSIDEIRIGEVFADVVPVPEPAGIGLVLMISAAMLVRAR